MFDYKENWIIILKKVRNFRYMIKVLCLNQKSYCKHKLYMVSGLFYMNRHLRAILLSFSVVNLRMYTQTNKTILITDENISSTQGSSTRVEYENCTFLISKITFSTSSPLVPTTPKDIIYIFIHFLAFVCAALVFANICLYLYHQRKQRKSLALRATFQHCPEHNSIIV